MAPNLWILETKTPESHVCLSVLKTFDNGSLSSCSYLLSIIVDVGVLCLSQTIKIAFSFELRKEFCHHGLFMMAFFFSNIAFFVS